MTDWSKVDLLIGIPVGGGVEPECMRSVIATLDALRALGAKAEWTYSKAPSIAMARAELVWDALHKTDARTHLLMVDSDLEFPPDVVVRMVARDVDVIGCTYRMKSGEPTFISFVIDMSPEQLQQAPVDGAISVRRIGGGLMLVRRGALERLCGAHPELRYRWADTTGAGDRWAIGLFAERIGPEGDIQTDDWVFCDRWRELGGEVWCLLDAETKHYGRGVGPWRANYAEAWAIFSEQARATGRLLQWGDGLSVRVDGTAPPQTHPGMFLGGAPAPGRNEPCPCGSGRKFKKCHGGAVANGATP